MKKFLILFLLLPTLAFGAASYPTSVKSYTDKVDNVDDVMAADINSLQDEVVAIETALGAGKATSVVQVVNVQTGAMATGSTVMVLDDTIPQNTEGNEYMTLEITPKATTNKLKIDVVFNGGESTNTGNGFVIALFQDATAGALAAICTTEDAAGEVPDHSFTHYMEAGTTSATTFKVRAGVDNGQTTFNGQNGARKMGGVLASSITITEYKA